jgi:hypothetical protein
MMKGKHETIEVTFHSLLTLAPDGGELPALQSGSFAPGKIIPCVYLTRGWMALELVWTWWQTKKIPASVCLSSL